MDAKLIERYGLDLSRWGRVGFKGGDDTAAERLYPAGVPRTRIDGSDAVGRLVVEKYDVAVAGPNLVLGGVFSLFDLGLQVSAFVAIKVGDERTIGDLARDALPREPKFDLLAEIPPWLLDAPNQRTGIQPRGGSALAGPLSDLLAKHVVPRPPTFRGTDDERELGRILDGGAVVGEGHDGDACAFVELGLDQRSHGRVVPHDVGKTFKES